jgi:hypothetical protein
MITVVATGSMITADAGTILNVMISIGEKRHVGKVFWPLQDFIPTRFHHHDVGFLSSSL